MLSKNEMARRLAGHHYEIESGLVEIYRLTGPDESLADEPVARIRPVFLSIGAEILPCKLLL